MIDIFNIFCWDPETFPRYRNHYFSELQPRLIVETETGGKIRDRCLEDNEELKKLKGYLYDEDDIFKVTYAHWVFEIPEEHHHLWKKEVDYYVNPKGLFYQCFSNLAIEVDKVADYDVKLNPNDYSSIRIKGLKRDFLNNNYLKEIIKREDIRPNRKGIITIPFQTNESMRKVIEKFFQEKRELGID